VLLEVLVVGGAAGVVGEGAAGVVEEVEVEVEP
jgi:hypothetical protein